MGNRKEQCEHLLAVLSIECLRELPRIKMPTPDWRIAHRW